ncbi:cytochrome P450 [Coprinopsis cinerea AmutBmut pab1-1]|nr:cytochrome P450 [Coprinopsis cinerea AmutBmut pab1-1]
MPEDIPQLPYIQAIVKELSRWHTVAPLCIPHAVKDDDEYQGYFLPKGSIVFPNTWAIMHDPKVFEDPMKFKPERYLKDGKINPDVRDAISDGSFGYGRRVCPGRYLSNDALAYFTACLLSVFNITPPKDENGNPTQMPETLEVTSKELLSSPLPYECDITLRSARHAILFSE